MILVETWSKGFIHYELSNFGKEDYFSKNNSAYWLGKNGHYSAQVMIGSRSWNIANNPLF
jgi:oxygen-independent coproporphyrinogen-3 oxidase